MKRDEFSLGWASTRKLIGALALGSVLSACRDRTEEAPGPHLKMDFAAARAEEVFAAPFPGEHLRTGDGSLLLDSFPTNDVVITNRLRDILLADADGFGTSSTIYFTSTDDIDEATLPTPFESVTEAASIFLTSVDESSLDFGARIPIEVEYRAGARAGGVPQMLSLLPLPGVPLRESTLYAAVVTAAVRTTSGDPLVPAAEMVALRNGTRVAGLEGAARRDFDTALGALETQGTDLSSLSAVAVFRTGTPTGGLVRAVAQWQDTPLPEVRAWRLAETFDDYCVYEGLTDMPTFQTGDPPYLFSGGAWQYDSQEFALQATESARVVLTLPRRPVPENGFPAVVFARVGAGGERPLVDRGVHQTPGGEAEEPGTGPALEFAHAGFAALSIDGPHGGLRNTLGADEQLLVYNYANPVALRDNVRQSALELTLHARMLAALELDASDCAGVATTATFDAEHLASFGHSMGASITPLAVATEPSLRAAIFSGAGASFIENVVYKKSPFEVLPTASMLAGLPEGELLDRHDPLLCLLQWAGEPADPPLYNRRILDDAAMGGARHVLVFQGIRDTYIPSPVANAFNLSIGVDLAGDVLDLGDEACPDSSCSLEPRLALVGREHVPLPASGNRLANDRSVTAVVVQHVEDGIEDGHEVVFQKPAPKAQYREFLESWLDGVPQVPANH